MSNIILTNICNRRCFYCFARQHMADTRKKELSFKNLKVILGFLEQSKEKVVRLIGGEPTLHSKFRQFINYILSRGFAVHIFTNGLFSTNVTRFFANKGKSIKYSFNIDPPEMYSLQNWKLILNNLKTVASFENCLLSRVIWQEKFNINYLLDLAEKYSIKIIMLRLANPIISANKYISLARYPVLVKNIICEVKKACKRKIKIGFGCGFAKKFLTKKQLELLKSYGIVDLKWGCDSNSGRFDIDTDLTVFRCLPLSEWRRKKLSDFKDAKEVESYFAEIMEKYQYSNSHLNLIHQGPCFAHLLKKTL